VVEAARAQLVKCGITTDAQEKLKSAILESGNSFGETKDRKHWLSKKEFSQLPEKSDYVYFVGCFDSYRYPEFAQKTFEVLQRFGVTPSCLMSSAALHLCYVQALKKKLKK